MEPKISVVVPTYQRPVLLQQCIEALINQDFEKDRYEVIVVSDGPDDSTEKIVAALAAKTVIALRYIPLKQKKGPAAARNAGWKMSVNNLVAFTDDDCIPDSGWLKFFAKKYKGEKEIAFTGKVIVPVSKCPTDFERNTQGLESAEFVTANCACTRAALEKVNGFDESFHMAWREDSDLEFKLLYHNVPICPVKEAVIIHPVRQARWGVSIREQKKGMFNALLFKKYPALYRQKIQRQPAWNYYIMNSLFLLMVAGIVLKSGVMIAIGLAGWVFMMVQFILKRLANTSRSFNHVLEMIVTSLLIPFLSVYWQLYGAFKYRVFFL